MGRRPLSDAVPSDKELIHEPRRNDESLITDSGKLTEKGQYGLNIALDKWKFIYKQFSEKIKDIEYFMSSDADLDADKYEFEDWKNYLPCLKN